MAVEEHLEVLGQGVETWNAWRVHNPGIQPDLSEADLSGMHLPATSLIGSDLTGTHLSDANLNFTQAHLSRAQLSEANLSKVNLSGADLSGATLHAADFHKANLMNAKLREANLREANLDSACLDRADLVGANLSEANLYGANLVGADLSKAILDEANLRGADLDRASLAGANLQHAIFVGTQLTDTDLTGCRVYGISAWDLKLDGAKQENLIVTRDDQPEITVDNLEVAQFIYLLLHNEKIRHVIDTITSKVVLILGRFTPERKAVLDALRDELRRRGYSPVVFDFDRPGRRSTVETVATLAHMARFVIADLTEAKSVLLEMQAVVPNNPSVPVQPLILATQEEPGMFDFFRLFPWVLESYRYSETAGLLGALTDHVIGPAEAKVLELHGVKPPV